jgi:ATP-binding protein involved in chromosome partitioning
MTEQVNLRIIGVVENMSYFVCPACDAEHAIFGEGGGELLAETLDAELLGKIPLQETLRKGADGGVPVVVSEPDSPAGKALLDIARKIAKHGPSLVGKRLPLLGGRMGEQSAGGHAGHNHGNHAGHNH